MLCTGSLAGTAADRPASPSTGPTFTLSQFTPGQPLHIVAYGDSRFTDPSVNSGTNPRVRHWLAEQIGKISPQVLLITGDTPYTGAKEADWIEFEKETASWRSDHIVQLPTIGNHEVYGGPGGIANYLKYFPETRGHRDYSALLGNVEVISLDMTTSRYIPVGQSQWFDAQLDHVPTQVQFIFILYHLPWMADEQSRLLGGQPEKDALRLRNVLESHLNRLHARVIVLNGHLHTYERFERKGVEYIVTGGGGAIPYPVLVRGSADLYRDPGFPVYHYLTIDVDKGHLSAVMWKIKDPNAPTLTVEAKDHFEMTAP